MDTNDIDPSDLERLDAEIALSRRMAAFHDGEDAYLAEAYERDAEDLQDLRDTIARGDLAEAGRLANSLETYVREEIPRGLYRTLMQAAGLLDG